jgi:hypothetical protein
MRKFVLAAFAAFFLVTMLPDDALAGGKRRGKKAAVSKSSGGHKGGKRGARGAGPLDADLVVHDPRAVLPSVPPPDLTAARAPGAKKRKGGASDVKLGAFDTGKKGRPGTSIKYTTKIPGLGGRKGGRKG